MKMRLLVTSIISAFILGITPNAFAADTEAPKLVDWRLIQTEIDISDSDGILRVQFILSDESNIATPSLLLKSTSTTQMSDFAVVRELNRSGKLISYEAQARIKIGQSPKIWEWVLYPLRDTAGNSATNFGPGPMYKSQVTVTNKIYNLETKRCELASINWNNSVEIFNWLERSFKESQNIALFKLRTGGTFPEKVTLESCPNPSILKTYLNVSNFLVASSDLFFSAKSLARETLQEQSNEIELQSNIDQSKLDPILNKLSNVLDAALLIAKEKGVINSVDASTTLSLIEKMILTSNENISRLQNVNQSAQTLANDSNIDPELQKQFLAFAGWTSGPVRSIESNLRNLALQKNRITQALTEIPRIAEIRRVELANQNSKKELSTKKTTITCIKGKLTKKVTAVKPKCPSGYTVKK